MTVTQEGPLTVFRKDVWFAETGYKPHPGQVIIHNDQTRHQVVVNGRRWGKTLLGGKETETKAFVKNFLGNPQRGWIVGPEFRDCEKEFRVVYDTFKALGIDQVSSKFLSNVDNGNMHITTKWGFDLECRSAKHPESLTGEGLDFVLMVEAGKHKRKTWTEYIRPALSDKRGRSLHSGVPEGATENSLLYTLYQRGQDTTKKAWQSWQMPSWTNTAVFPGGLMDPEIQDAKDDLTDEEFARQYGAQFVERVGRVMKEWDDDWHIKDLTYNREWPLYVAVDYGYTNPFVILWIQTDPFDNVYVIKEQRYTLMDTLDVAKDVKSRYESLVSKIVAIYPDPAEPDDTQTLMKVWKKPARMNTGGTIKSRLELIRSSLKLQNDYLPDDHPDKRATLQIDRSCEQLIWEMRQGYRWPEHRSDIKNDDENPLDKNNHGPEALGRFYKGHYGIKNERRRSRQHTAKMGK